MAPDTDEIAVLRGQANAAFERMRAAELLMDDMDIVEETALFGEAMDAAREWRRLEDELVRRTKDQETAHEARMEKWAREYDELNGAPESAEDS